MNTFKFVRCSKIDVRVRSMVDKMVFDTSLQLSTLLMEQRSCGSTTVFYHIIFLPFLIERYHARQQNHERTRNCSLPGVSGFDKKGKRNIEVKKWKNWKKKKGSYLDCKKKSFQAVAFHSSASLCSLDILHLQGDPNRNFRLSPRRSGLKF